MNDPLLDQLLIALDRAVEWAGDPAAGVEHECALDAVEARLQAVARHLDALGGQASASPYLDFLRRLRRSRRTDSGQGVRVAASA